MTEHEQGSPGIVLGHEGPTLIDFRVGVSHFQVGINGPGLLFSALELRTSLHLQDGCDYAALRKLIDGFKTTAFCGHSPPATVMAHVVGSAIAPHVLVDVGPPSMYMSRLRFETNGKETFAELCNRTLNPLGRSNYMVALVPILNENGGHGEHSSHAFDAMRSTNSDRPERIRTSTRPRYRIEHVLGERGSD